MNAAQQLLAQWTPVQAVPPLPRTTTVFGRTVPVPNGAVLPQPAGYPYVVNDKLGDPRMIWRGLPIPQRQRSDYDGELLRRIRSGEFWLSYGVGSAAGGLTVEKVIQGKLFMGATRSAYADAVRLYGSQRKAATALGISLGKLQRGLRK